MLARHEFEVRQVGPSLDRYRVHCSCGWWWWSAAPLDIGEVLPMLHLAAEWHLTDEGLFGGHTRPRPRGLRLADVRRASRG